MKIAKTILKSSIALWNKKEGASEKAPIMSGFVTITRSDLMMMAKGIGDAAAVQVQVGLWATDRRSEKSPVLSGTLTIGDREQAVREEPKVEAVKVEPKRVKRVEPKPLKGGTGTLTPEEEVLAKALLAKMGMTV